MRLCICRLSQSEIEPEYLFIACGIYHGCASLNVFYICSNIINKGTP